MEFIKDFFQKPLWFWVPTVVSSLQYLGVLTMVSSLQYLGVLTVWRGVNVVRRSQDVQEGGWTAHTLDTVDVRLDNTADRGTEKKQDNLVSNKQCVKASWIGYGMDDKRLDENCVLRNHVTL